MRSISELFDEVQQLMPRSCQIVLFETVGERGILNLVQTIQIVNQGNH
jgi:hypothetical protein